MRFTRAQQYETDREWKRYEGTPQRDLLRLVRERFLLRSLKNAPPSARIALEVGPGPGRFTPLILSSAPKLVLLELSPRMLEEAIRTAEQATEPPVPVQGVLGDATRMPIREESVSITVALGNVVGMSGDRSLAGLQELAGSLRKGGVLIVETVGERRSVPRFVGRVHPGGWATLLRQEPSRGLPPRLSEGMVDLPPSEERGRLGEFQFLEPDAVVRFLVREGFSILDQMIAAPLTGGDPALVRRIAEAHRGDIAPLLRWEESAGRFPAILKAGGHTLTCAVAG